MPSRARQLPLAALAVVVLTGFLAVHTWKDLTAPAAAWYFRSTYLWAIVMGSGTAIYWREVRALRQGGVDLQARFAQLPPE